jgi:hypothetical protein
MIAGQEMLSILRKILAEAPPPRRTQEAMTSDAALKHLYELDPAAGREAIRSDLQNARAQPGLDVVKLLAEADLASAAWPAAERIGKGSARELDYELVERYADDGALPVVRAGFEKKLGNWACVPQSAILRYFLWLDPAYGVEQVSASLAVRKQTACYRNLLGDLGAELPKVQQVAIDALEDADTFVVQDAANALRKWGTKDAEVVLWEHLQRFHEQLTGGEDELSWEQVLVTAIAKGTNLAESSGQIGASFRTRVDQGAGRNHKGMERALESRAGDDQSLLVARGYASLFGSAV